jgi:hypothetical protein
MGLNRELRGYNSRVRKLTKTVTEADLTSAVNGTAQAITIGALPTGSTVLQVAFKLRTQFTGGGATSVGVTIGDTTGGVGRYGTGINAFGGTVGTVFINPTTPGLFAGSYAVDDTITAIFTPDGSHTLLALTAGAIDFEIVVALADVGS